MRINIVDRLKTTDKQSINRVEIEKKIAFYAIVFFV